MLAAEQQYLPEFNALILPESCSFDSNCHTIALQLGTITVQGLALYCKLGNRLCPNGWKSGQHTGSRALNCIVQSIAGSPDLLNTVQAHLKDIYKL